MVFSFHYAKIGDVDVVTCVVVVVKDGGRRLLVFFESICKITNVFFIAPMFTAFVSINDSTFACDRILVLWSHKEAFYGLSFEMYLHPKFVACSFYSFLVILMAGSIGMDVNSALTSYDMMHSSGWSFIFLMLSRNSLLFCT